MAEADLHVHSTASDGRFAPREVVRRAFGVGLAGLALTDHDTLAGVPEAAAEARRLGLVLVPAAEISVVVEGRDIHILAYQVDPADPRLQALLRGLQQARVDRAHQMVARLGHLGYPLRMEDVIAEARGAWSVGRAHVARALVRTGRVGSTTDAFQKLIGDGGPADVLKRTPPPVEVLGAIWGAGGVPVIAHPGLYGLEEPEAFFSGWEIAGIEVGHPAQSEALQASLAAWAARRGLVATAGSDWHGDEDPSAYLGCWRVDLQVIDQLRARRRNSPAR